MEREKVEGSSPDRARGAGRGGLAVLGAKLFFLVIGFALQPLLRLVLGRNEFGVFAQAQVISNTVNNVVISSGTQGVSRAVAGAKGHEDEALRVALRVHAPLSVAVAGLVALAVPFYVAFEKAEDVRTPLYVLAGVSLLYGLYAPLIGCLNGRNLFGRQALLDVTFATLRTAGLLGCGYAFVHRGMSGVLGATVGWVGAALVIVPLALRWTGFGRALPKGAPPPEGVLRPGRYLAVLIPIAGAQFATNALMQIDLGLLGRFLSDGAASAHLADEAQREAVTRWLAIYKECQNFAFLPYQLLFSITLILFPMVARARAEGDQEAVRAYVARGARLAAIFCGLMVSVIVAMPESMLALVFPKNDAADGADVLRVMVLAQGAFSMLGIATTVLTSVGREWLSALLTATAVVVVGIACFLAVPAATFGHDQLVRSAEAAGVGLAVTMVVAGFLVRSATGAFVPTGTILRTLVALAGFVALGYVTPRFGKLLTPVVAAALAAAYFLILALLREIGKADLATVRALRGKKA